MLTGNPATTTNFTIFGDVAQRQVTQITVNAW